MKTRKGILFIQISSVIGLVLLLLGHYLITTVDLPDKKGVEGIVICATCIAFGFVFLIPTKIYITYWLVNYENNRKSKR